MAKEKGQETSGHSSDDKQNAISDQEVRQESSKAANAATNAQKKAKELRAAANGAGDPDERQKLLEQAIDKEVEAESFGKTAKYLRSGAFQGMAIGAGLGTAPSASLGALTGTLVGGVTTVITGGLGGGIGAAAGALHGPVVNMGELAGKGIRKVTGDLPGWVASPEQKQALENMVGQVKEQDMPDEEELKKLQEDGGDVAPDEDWMKSAQGTLPSMNKSDDSPSDSKSKEGKNSLSNGTADEKQPSQRDTKKDSQDKEQKQSREQDDAKEESSTTKEKELQDQLAEKDSRISKLEDELQHYKDRGSETNKPKNVSKEVDSGSGNIRKKPRKLESKSSKDDADLKDSGNSKPQPRKLEKRSS